MEVIDDELTETELKLDEQFKQDYIDYMSMYISSNINTVYKYYKFDSDYSLKGVMLMSKDTINLNEVGSNVMAAINSKSTEIIPQELWDIYDTDFLPDGESPFNYITTLMTDPDVAGTVTGGGVEVYCVGPTEDYDPDNPKTNTLLKLFGSFQENGDIHNTYGGSTYWMNENGVIATQGDVKTDSTFVIVLKPLIFDRQKEVINYGICFCY